MTSFVGIVEAFTLTSHSESCCPFGNDVTTVPVIGSCVLTLDVNAAPVGDQLATPDQLSGAAT